MTTRAGGRGRFGVDRSLDYILNTTGRAGVFVFHLITTTAEGKGAEFF
jgi:hypothetical protein